MCTVSLSVSVCDSSGHAEHVLLTVFTAGGIPLLGVSVCTVCLCLVSPPLGTQSQCCLLTVSVLVVGKPSSSVSMCTVSLPVSGESASGHAVTVCL